MNNPAVTTPLSAGQRQQAIVGAVLTAQVVAVLALLPARQEALPIPAPEAAAAPPVAAPVAKTPKSRDRKREAADKRRIAASIAAKPAAASSTAAAAQADTAAKPDDVRRARQAADTVTARAEGSEIVEGIWVGVRSCPDSPDMHVALKIAADKAWVYSHSGPAAAPLSPGCLSATWSYDTGRTYLQVLPQAWLWRTAQTNALRLAGFVSGRHIDGEIADVSGCRALTLHKVAANAFPAECQ